MHTHYANDPRIILREMINDLAVQVHRHIRTVGPAGGYLQIAPPDRHLMHLSCRLHVARVAGAAQQTEHVYGVN